MPDIIYNLLALLFPARQAIWNGWELQLGASPVVCALVEGRFPLARPSSPIDLNPIRVWIAVVWVSLYVLLVYTVIGLSVIFCSSYSFLYAIIRASHLLICVLFVDDRDLWLLLSLLSAAAFHVSILLVLLFPSWLSMFSFMILDIITLLLRIGKECCSLLLVPSPGSNRLLDGSVCWWLVWALGLVASVFATFHSFIPAIFLGLLDDLRVLSIIFTVAIDIAQVLVVLPRLYGERAIIIL